FLAGDGGEGLVVGLGPLVGGGNEAGVELADGIILHGGGRCGGGLGAVGGCERTKSRCPKPAATASAAAESAAGVLIWLRGRRAGKSKTDGRPEAIVI